MAGLLKVLATVVLLGAIVAGDVFVDWPTWMILPEIWTCPGSSAGFQFCTP